MDDDKEFQNEITDYCTRRRWDSMIDRSIFYTISSLLMTFGCFLVYTTPIRFTGLVQFAIESTLKDLVFWFGVCQCIMWAYHYVKVYLLCDLMVITNGSLEYIDRHLYMTKKKGGEKVMMMANYEFLNNIVVALYAASFFLLLEGLAGLFCGFVYNMVIKGLPAFYEFLSVLHAKRPMFHYLLFFNIAHGLGLVLYSLPRVFYLTYHRTIKTYFKDIFYKIFWEIYWEVEKHPNSFYLFGVALDALNEAREEQYNLLKQEEKKEKEDGFKLLFGVQKETKVKPCENLGAGVLLENCCSFENCDDDYECDFCDVCNKCNIFCEKSEKDEKIKETKREYFCDLIGSQDLYLTYKYKWVKNFEWRMALKADLLHQIQLLRFPLVAPLSVNQKIMLVNHYMKNCTSEKNEKIRNTDDLWMLDIAPESCSAVPPHLIPSILKKIEWAGMDRQGWRYIFYSIYKNVMVELLEKTRESVAPKKMKMFYWASLATVKGSWNSFQTYDSIVKNIHENRNRNKEIQKQKECRTHFSNFVVKQIQSFVFVKSEMVSLKKCIRTNNTFFMWYFCQNNNYPLYLFGKRSFVIPRRSPPPLSTSFAEKIDVQAETPKESNDSEASIQKNGIETEKTDDFEYI